MLKSTKILVQYADERLRLFEFSPKVEGDAGIDLHVMCPDADEMIIQPFSFASLPTGLRVKIDENAWGCIRPRSSTFIKRQLFVMEGTIDSGYTGDLFVIVFNPSSVPKKVFNGERLGQIIPVPKFDQYVVEIVDKMPETKRGPNGFGSTDSKYVDQTVAAKGETK